MSSELLYFLFCCLPILCGFCPCCSGHLTEEMIMIMNLCLSILFQFVLVNVVVAVLMKHLEESHKQVSFFLFFYFFLSLLIINDVLVIYLVLSRWSLKICSLSNVLNFVTWKLKREFSNYLEEVWREKKGGIKQISHIKLRLTLIKYIFCHQVWD